MATASGKRRFDIDSSAELLKSKRSRKGEEKRSKPPAQLEQNDDRLGDESEDEIKSDVDDESADDLTPQSHNALMEAFRRNFEEQFLPLNGESINQSKEGQKQGRAKRKGKGNEQDREYAVEQEAEDEAWEGIQDAEETSVQVVEHIDVHAKISLMSKGEMKSFMSSKVPTNAQSAAITQRKSDIAASDEDDSEAANLQNDLALQRLLSESHLLDSASNATPSGKNRHKALDLRMQVLGAKSSIFQQDSMPMSHRKGMEAKRSQKEEKRRREAKENGIILERAKNTKKRKLDGKRDRGVGAPAVGRFSGGMLTLSKKDIYEIEGPKNKSSKGGRRGKDPSRSRG